MNHQRKKRKLQKDFITRPGSKNEKYVEGLGDNVKVFNAEFFSNGLTDSLSNE